MKDKSYFWSDFVLTVFTVTVALFYFGGYYFPVAIGSWTGLGMMVYLLVLIFAGLQFLFRILPKSKNIESDAVKAKKGANRP